VRKSVFIFSITAAVCLLATACVRADEDSVVVRYGIGGGKVGEVKEGMPAFVNKDMVVTGLPRELLGKAISMHADKWKQSGVVLNVPAGKTVYVLIDSDDDPNVKIGLIKQSRAIANSVLRATGWKRIDDGKCYIDSGAQPHLAVYQRTFDKAIKLGVPQHGENGVWIVADSLQVDNSHTQPPSGPANIGSRDAETDSNVGSHSASGPTTRPVSAQVTIKALEVYIQDSGAMVGQASDATLTLTRGEASRPVAVTFVTKIGDQMGLARDEALRYIRLSYPNWYVDTAEISFEDKYVNHDGGSIGTAVGTMILACIRGVQIDPNLAITGDISANGKVRAIGGVSAKLRGAIASKCTITAIPMENEGQLVDAVTYSGPNVAMDTQVIGISSLEDALGIVRIDREEKLRQAIEKFASFQAAANGKPAYLKTKDARDRLTAVLAAWPSHLSAKVLLAVAQNKQPHTLSAAASYYYVSVAVRPMLDQLKQRSKENSAQPPSATVKNGLADLRKLKFLLDPAVRPLGDAWARYLQAWDGLQRGEVSPESYDRQRQQLLDEMVKEQTDIETLQKMVKEGV